MDAAWWRCGARCCCYAATIVKARCNIMTSRCLNTYCDVTQCMDGLWIFITKTWIAQGRFINIIRTPSKQWGMCDKGSAQSRFWSRHKAGFGAFGLGSAQSRSWSRHKAGFGAVGLGSAQSRFWSSHIAGLGAAGYKIGLVSRQVFHLLSKL